MAWALESLEALRVELQKMPGIGTKSAERLAYHLLRCSEADALRLADAIRNVKRKIRQCSECFNITEEDPCSICSSTRRDPSLLCVVEMPRDVMAIEETGEYRGLYHVLQGRISPLEGIEPDHLTIEALRRRIRAGGVREVILATNPDIEGDGTALYISEILGVEPVVVTRIARGIPVGSNIEFVGKAILREAMSGRRGISEPGPARATSGG
jgi:recombination protein RecR